MTSNSNGEGDIRKRLREAIAHFHHILPSQPPLKDFVHHNTLHAYQHHRFPQALMEAQQLTGKVGYLPEAQYLELYHKGRITSKDLLEALNADPELGASSRIFTSDNQSILKRDIYLCGLLQTFKPVTGCQLNWYIEELSALERFQADVPERCRRKIIDSSSLGSEAEVVADLWSACLRSLGFEHYILHPEDLMDLSPDQAEAIISAFADSADVEDKQQFRVRRQMRLEAEVLLSRMLKRVGKEHTLRDVLKALTGEDVLDNIRPLLIRQLGNHLDEGVAAWHSSDQEQGFYASWRNNAVRDLAWVFDDFPGWHHILTSLPGNALDAIISELKHLGLPEPRWIGYLERLALQLPGWSGMFLWRHAHPGYKGLISRIDLLDYLAVFLILERLFARRLCRQIWNIAPDLDFLRWYFRTNKEEFLVRYALYNLRLPEYAVNRAHRLTSMVGEHVLNPEEWRYVAYMIWTWRHSPAADRPKGHSVYRSCWRLFRLAQHLGLHGGTIRALSLEQVETMLDCLDQLTPDKAGQLWLQAFENHYRDQLFNAVLHNHDRGRWKTRERRPQSQIVFCMDDREEGIRRHLEEHNPAI